MFTRSMSVLALVCCCSVSYAEDSVEIPLDTVWAYGMPGTLDIRKLDGVSSGEHDWMKEIRNHHKTSSVHDKAGPGFAVEGLGLEALKNAHAVITETKARPDSLSSSKDISLVFFSLEFGYYVHITHVERTGNTIEIKYKFVPHYTKNRTRHFALIPVGNLPKGKFSVSITPEPFDRGSVGKEFKEIPDERKLPLVSSSFDFTVQ